MSSQPLLSVVIQSYNYAHFIRDAIDSILIQDFPSEQMELIIIDDASTDNSRDIIQEYARKYPYIRPIFYEQNRGTHFSVNHSIDLAQGKYIHWLAADDFRDRQFLRKSMEALLANPAIGICCSDFGYVEERTGRSHLFSFPLLKGVSAPVVLQPDTLIKQLQTSNFWIPGHTTIVKKESVIRYGKFEAAIREKCDWYLFHYIALNEGVVYLPEVLAYLYSHSHSYSAKLVRTKETRKAGARQFLKFLDQQPSQKLFYRACLLGWVFRAIPAEFLKPNRWSAFLHLVARKLRKGLWKSKIYNA
ncbi:MAG: glycosyltransferase [Chlamydiia bacterium]|nr:glycosyltransferase [Chlamydiia bacterium]